MEKNRKFGIVKILLLIGFCVLNYESKAAAYFSEVVNGKMDTIYMKYSNTVVLPKAYRNLAMTLYFVDDKTVTFKLTKQKEGFIIEDLGKEGYYYLQLKDKQNQVVYQQLLFAKSWSNPIPTLNGDTIMPAYVKANLIKNFDFGLKFIDRPAKNKCQLLSYDLIVKPEGNDPQQLSLNKENNFDPIRRAEALKLLNNNARIFINNIIVKFDDEPNTRNIGPLFFVVKD